MEWSEGVRCERRGVQNSNGTYKEVKVLDFGERSDGGGGV